MLSTLVLSGMVAGVGGVMLELGQLQALTSELVNDNTGYIGLIVAAIAASSFLGCVPSALLLAAVAAAGDALQLVNISGDIVYLITGILLIVSCAEIRWPARRPRITQVDREPDDVGSSQPTTAARAR